VLGPTCKRSTVTEWLRFAATGADPDQSGSNCNLLGYFRSYRADVGRFVTAIDDTARIALGVLGAILAVTGGLLWFLLVRLKRWFL